ncbi:MAG TPA: hypothetical protein VE011_10445 [Candidatus Dormibacteraeota bacterium]|nr:hypothetical protein [Candidatus Dormibacteraeota bacterium]
MTVVRMDNVGIVAGDAGAPVDFFVGLARRVVGLARELGGST